MVGIITQSSITAYITTSLQEIKLSTLLNLLQDSTMIITMGSSITVMKKYCHTKRSKITTNDKIDENINVDDIAQDDKIHYDMLENGE